MREPRTSEGRYRAIFDSLIMAVCLLEIVFDEQGEAVDVIVRDANAAQDRIDGVRALIGHRVGEIRPDIEMKWIQRYGDVARTGVAEHFEDWSEANQRWYEVTATRVGKPEEALVAIIHNDITERKRAAEILRRSEERQAFLLQLSKAALHASEVTRRVLIDAVDELYMRIDVKAFDEDGGGDDFRVVEANAAMRSYLRGIDPIGRSLRELVPAIDAIWARTFGRIAKQGGSMCLEHELLSGGDVFNVFAVKIGPPELHHVAVIARDVTARHRQEQSLERSLGERGGDVRALSQHLFTAQDEQQRRIAQELHDSVGQRVALIGLHAGQLQHMAGDLPAEAGTALQQILSHISELAREIRDVSHALHPPVITDLGIGEALQSLVDEQRAAGIAVDLEVDSCPHLPVDSATALYRITQEVLSNSARHAPGAAVHIALRKDAADGTRIILGIRDDGPGFDLAAVRNKGGLGLVSILQRAQAIGAKFSIESHPGEGTAVTVMLPLGS